MQKTIIGKFPPQNPPQQQQQHQPRLGQGQNNYSPMGSNYVILPPEEMPAADPFLNSKINQEQDERKCSLLEDGPCSLPIVRMISSGSFSSTSHPLSALPLQFQADPEDDDYTRKAKEQAAWEAATMEAEVALASRVSSGMDVQHQSTKRPRSLTEDSPGREGKILAQASGLETPALLLLTNGDPEAMQQSDNTATTAGLESTPEDSDQATHSRSSRFQSVPTPLFHWAPSVEGIPTTVDVPYFEESPSSQVPLMQFSVPVWRA
jgi:hypothetical protein